MSRMPNNTSLFIEEDARTEDDSAAQLPHSTPNKGFPPQDSSGSDEEEAVGSPKERTMEDLLAFLQQEEGNPTDMEFLFQHKLQNLKEAHRQQLRETGQLHQQGLESRMLHNSVLSGGNERKARANRHLEEPFSSNGKKSTDAKPCLEAPRHEVPRRSHSLSDLSSVKTLSSRASQQPRGSQKPVTVSAAWASGTTVPQPFDMTLRETQKKLQLLQYKVPQDVQRLLQSKRETEDAECQKQFRATPALGHVFLSLCRDVTEARERARKTALDQRRDFLLSMQRPFSFCEREEKKKEEMIRQLGSPAPSPNTTKSVKVRKPIPKAVKDPGVSEHLKEEEQHRKIRIQTRAQDMLRSSTAPIDTHAHRDDREKRSAQRTKEEALGFLEEKPTFQPRTNSQVPDFERLYRAFQKEASRRAQQKDVTRCQPFQLRTSALPPRKSREGCVPSQEQAGKTDLKRSHSFSGITSLSMDTLPIYITDAARERCSAIRRSMEGQASKEKESVRWMQRHNMESRAMKNTVTSRAKAMDPHRSLKEVYHEKLKQHRETDQKRMKEYKMELQEMKTRVKVRPYLFEQVTQKNAKSNAERRYRVRLEQAGLNEHFVKEQGEGAGETPPFTSDEEDHSRKVA